MQVRSGNIEVKMRGIVFALFALAFMQVVRGQSQACSDAVTAFVLNNRCLTLLNTADPSLCFGTCGILADAVLAACQNDNVS